MIAAITMRRMRAESRRRQTPAELGVFFMTGLFALLATGTQGSATADAVMDRYVTTIVKGMETR